jgi:protein-S-isoprenylcysteine O-methyltransferase Ste14
MLNIVQIAAIEEPLLRRKFGVEYTRYCRNVHRFVPRLSPWTQHETKQDARTS